MTRIASVVLGACLALGIAAPAHATLNACAAAKKLCVAKKVAALLTCHAKNEKPPGVDPAKFAACVQKAKDKFDGGSDPSKGCFAKLEAKFGADCLTASDTVPVEGAVEAFVDDVICRLDPAGGTCPLATPTPTATATPVPPSCSDGIKNGGETDVDCGGPTCGACAFGDACAVANDCATLNCSGNVCACGAGTLDCNGNAGDACEVTPATDPANCGSCNHMCSLANATSGCAASQCTIASCNPGFANCNATTADGCERSTTSDPSNCGSCGNICSSNHGTPSCVASQCQIACSSGFANCDNLGSDGCEVNTNSDSNNCGTCGHVCASGHSCVGGTCS